jgi:predicted dienelactone hydrolase
MKIFTIAITLMTLLSGFCYAKADMSGVNVVELTTSDKQRQRPIKLRVWYPANVSEKCVDAQICLSAHAKKDQAILLMHGAMGSVRAHNWLGYAMASQGFLVVGVDHFGESWSYGVNTIDPSSVVKLELRPTDISSVLNQLNNNKLIGSSVPFSDSKIQWNNTTAVGHSSGGMAAFLLAGAQADINSAMKYCQSTLAENDRSCLYTKNIPKSNVVNAPLSRSFTDSRIKRIIALDPAGGHLLTENSLKSLRIPVMIIGSQRNDFLPFNQHAKHYAQAINNAQLVSLNNGEGHFVYLDKCEHAYKSMGVSLCQDKKGVDRELVHASLYPKIFKFLYTRN